MDGDFGKMKYTIEYRGRIIINHRGAKDYLRIKKEKLPHDDSLRWALTQDGIPFKIGKTEHNSHDS